MFSSFFSGFINGLLGTGGGILAVSAFRRQGLTPNQAHATAVALMFPLSIISLAALLFQIKAMHLLCYWPLLLPTLLGSTAGSWLLRQINPRQLRLLFAILILYSAVRILCT